ncbi:MAG: 3-phosphoshikimate 1-carboxyvinyltransferase [delta proteobacterium ML8_F1]|nr:MAG: 3-phosphoshikimate 1-carboxyvinyltransferase [delta proteobacterium ML8_F1]
MQVTIQPQRLKGTLKIPPSKSVSHRAVIAASLARGHSKVSNLLYSNDILATCDAMEGFGALINKRDNWAEIIATGQLKNPGRPIDCKESGSTLRFLVPLGGVVEEPVVFTGEGRLKTRPMTPYFEIFKDKNIRYAYNDALPLSVEGALTPGTYSLAGDVSSQFITGLLFVLPLLQGDSEITVTSPLESKPYVDISLEVLKTFGIRVENYNHEKFVIPGFQQYTPADFTVEGDYSQAAFWIVAGLIGGEITVEGLRKDTLQGDRAIIDIARAMGGNIETADEGVVARKSRTRGMTIDASQCPDLVPILTVLAALSEGKTRIVNASRLRLKESDRLKAIAEELNKLGAQIIENPDGLDIYGKEHLKGGEVDSWKDHRIAMSLAIASIRCTEAVSIHGAQAIEKSYPNFFEHFKSLGGLIIE